MPGNTTENRSSSRKRTTLYFDILGVFLILFAPYLSFIIHNDVIFGLANVIVIVFFIFVSFLLALLFLYTESVATKICIVSILIIMFIDIQFDFSRWWGWKVVAVILASSLLSWILHKHLIRIVSVVFGTIVVATAIAPFVKLSFEHSLGQASEVGDFDTSLPIYIHMILDEHIGTGGLEDVVPQQKTLKREIATFLSEYGYRNFGRAYSQYYDSVDSISVMLQMNDIRNIKTLYSYKGVGSIFTLHTNSYFNHLESKGYNICLSVIILGLLWIHKKEIAEMPYVRQFRTVEQHSSQDAGAGKKTMVLVSVYTNLSTFVVIVRGIYNTLRDDLDARGFDLPAWKNWDGRMTSLGASVVFDELIEDVSSASRGTLFFAHLLMPHDPYALESDCTIRRPIMAWHYRVVKSPEERASRYAEYGDQVRCVKLKLVALMDALKKRGMFDDATIILHGDHGSRIGLVEPRVPNKARLSRQDYVDAFSTLFAVKAADIEPGYDHRMLPLARLLHDTVSGDLMAPTKPGQDETSFVFLHDADTQIYEKVPMPEFGARPHLRGE